MINAEKHNAGTFIFSLISEILSPTENIREEEEGPMNDRLFYGMMAILTTALGVVAVVFRTFR